MVAEYIKISPFRLLYTLHLTVKLEMVHIRILVYLYVIITKRTKGKGPEMSPQYLIFKHWCLFKEGSRDSSWNSQLPRVPAVSARHICTLVT
jgi:hypothetical protein